MNLFKLTFLPYLQSLVQGRIISKEITCWIFLTLSALFLCTYVMFRCGNSSARPMLFVEKIGILIGSMEAHTSHKIRNRDP